MWHIIREILEAVSALSSNGGAFQGWPSEEGRPAKFWISAVIGITLFALVVGTIWRFYLGAFLKP